MLVPVSYKNLILRRRLALLNKSNFCWVQGSEHASSWQRRQYRGKAEVQNHQLVHLQQNLHLGGDLRAILTSPSPSPSPPPLMIVRLQRLWSWRVWIKWRTWECQKAYCTYCLRIGSLTEKLASNLNYSTKPCRFYWWAHYALIWVHINLSNIQNSMRIYCQGRATWQR